MADDPLAPTIRGDDARLEARDAFGIDTALIREIVARRVFGEDREPVRIGRYPVLQRVGQGGMGVVYAAYDNDLDRKVAIKLLRRERDGDDAQAERLRIRMLREAKALARLSHPAIVQVFEAGEHDGQVFLAMEFVTGSTLRQWRVGTPRTWQEIVDVYVDAGRGLAAAHAGGLVHRDFKPDNAMVSDDAASPSGVRVRVLDFGLALSAGDTTERATASSSGGDAAELRITATGAIVGTPAYMAPEQLAGGSGDAKSDQFSFAVALFEALHGKRPFQGKTLAELGEALAAGRLADVPANKLPRRVGRCLERALSHDPTARFDSMDALLIELRPRARRGWWFLGLGTIAVAALAGAAHQASRSGDLESRAHTAEGRADDAEARLRAREETVIVREAQLLLADDPTRAAQALAEVPSGAEAWSTSAWEVATRAADLGVADRIAPVPDGWAGDRMIDRETVLLRGEWGTRSPFGAALWHVDSGEIEELSDDASEHVVVSPRAEWLLTYTMGTSSMIEPRIVHRRTGIAVPLQSRHCDAIAPAGWARHERRELHTLCSSSGDGIVFRWDEPLDVGDTIVLRETLEPAAGRVGLEPGSTLLGRNPGAHVAMGTDGVVTLMRPSGPSKRVEIPGRAVTAEYDAQLRWLAITTADGFLWLVDAEATDPEPRPFAWLRSPARRVSWSDDGARLLAFTEDEHIVGWSVPDAAERFVVRAPEGSRSGTWEADGRVASIGQHEYRSWSAPTYEIVANEVVALDGAPGHAALLHTDGSIEVRTDVADARTLPALETRIDSMAISPDGGLVATSGDHRLTVRTLDGRVVLSRPTYYLAVARLVFLSPTTLGWRDESKLQLHTLGEAEPRVLEAPQDGDWSTLRGDGPTVLATVDYRGMANDRLLRLDPATARIIDERELPLRAITRVLPLPDDRLVLATHAGALVIQDGATGEVRELSAGGSAFADVEVLIADSRLVTRRADESLEIWDIASGRSHRLTLAERYAGLPAPDPRDADARADELEPSRMPILVADPRVVAHSDGGMLFVDAGHRALRYTPRWPSPGESTRAWVARITER